MTIKNGTTVSFRFCRIPLDAEYDMPVSIDTVAFDLSESEDPVVTISVFHETLSGSAADGDLKTAPPSFFEVAIGERLKGFRKAQAAILCAKRTLQLDEDEIKDLTNIISYTTPKKHSKFAHLTNFRLNRKHWEWAYETAGEVEITPNSGDGLLVHATVGNESTLTVKKPLETSVLGDAALDPFDEDEFGGVRHHNRIPRQARMTLG